MTKLVNATNLIKKAYQEKYAVPHININNLEWAKTTLLAAEEMQSPLIIGVSEGAIKYMGGYKTVANMVNGLIDDLNISIPVALHLDHGTKQGCYKAVEAGFSSIMFDGSSLEFDENYSITKELVNYCQPLGISVEAEVGSIGGEEDGIISDGELADPKQAKQMVNLGISMLAAGFGNIHGPYPKSWKSLNFERLSELSQCGIGLVMHGGSGVPMDQVKKAISLGVAKINVNTELQQSFHKATRAFILSNKDLEGKNFDPRKLLKNGVEAMRQTVIEKIIEFGSKNKA
ncbi:Fructose-bisphosphate aldolase (Fba) [Mycoplasmopsis bovigenitalium 51080]|uniref:Fructose-bisphosphate aldolase (Fba) n=1 Tax=Mycoplasmopsis bovigenitalium 51080 TaxID=1188235 RepID=N9VDF8_9BACT|nr:class II fructose-1,6-bisphosphate aldolase [Mycoplasmopsis bovigenitalium]ENY69456.1 Fructose-bisphosphate aldolase (Fba) [Mycoplasmopsis bovigenitalium 51080]